MRRVSRHRGPAAIMGFNNPAGGAMNAGTDRQTDPTAASAGGQWRSAKYQHWVARTSRILDILAVVFLVDFLAGLLAPGGPPWWQPTLTRCPTSGSPSPSTISSGSAFPPCDGPSSDSQTRPADGALPMLRMLRVVLLLRKAFRSLPTERIAGSSVHHRCRRGGRWAPSWSGGSNTTPRAPTSPRSAPRSGGRSSPRRPSATAIPTR